MFFVPLPGDPGNQLFLDSAYSQLKYSESNPGWAVLLTDGGTFQTFHVTDARQISKAAYSLSAKSTRLTFTETINLFTFPLRTTTVLTGNARQPLQISLPVSDPLSGSTADSRRNPHRPSGWPDGGAAGESLHYESARRRIRHPRWSATARSGQQHHGPEPQAAACQPVCPRHLLVAGQYCRSDPGRNREATRFWAAAMARRSNPTRSRRSRSRICRRPIPRVSPPLHSTLIVTVDGVAWKEQPTLVSSASDAQDYTTTLDDSGQTTVVFGDGFNGARPPSGVNNIHARYRKGLGTSGNVAARRRSATHRQCSESAEGDQSRNRRAAETIRKVSAAFRELAPGEPAHVQSCRERRRLCGAGAQLSRHRKGKRDLGVCRTPVTLKPIPHPYVQLTVATADQTPVPFQGTLLAGSFAVFSTTIATPTFPCAFWISHPCSSQWRSRSILIDRFPRQATLNRCSGSAQPRSQSRWQRRLLRI